MNMTTHFETVSISRGYTFCSSYDKNTLGMKCAVVLEVEGKRFLEEWTMNSAEFEDKSQLEEKTKTAVGIVSRQAIGYLFERGTIFEKMMIVNPLDIDTPVNREGGEKK